METIIKEKSKYYDLSYPQKRILRIENLYKGTPVCNIGGITRIKGKLDIDIIIEAINIFIENNESLRLRIKNSHGYQCQYIGEFEREDVFVKYFSKEENPLYKADQWSREYFNIPFEFFDSKLYRIALYKASENDYGIVFSIHHIIGDGWSTCLIQKRILEIYFELYNNGKCECITEPSYIDFLDKEKKYIDSDRFIKDGNYLKDLFEDIDEEFLYNGEYNGVGIRKEFNLTEDFSENINEFLENNKFSKNVLFTSIMGLYLYYKTNKRDTVIGNSSFNRMTRKERATVGMCANIMPVKITIDENKTFLRLLEDVSSILKKGFYHQQYPYNKLIEDLNLNDRGFDNLFRFRVNCYKSDYFTDNDDFEFEIEEYYNGYQNYSTQIITKEITKNNIILCIDYKPSEYKEKDIIEIYDFIISVLSKALKNPSEVLKNII